MQGVRAPASLFRFVAGWLLAGVVEQQRARLAVYSRPPRPQNNHLRRNAALVVAAMAGVAFGVSMALAKRVPQDRQIAVLVTAIVGALVCTAAVICAAVWHSRLRA